MNDQQLPQTDEFGGFDQGPAATVPAQRQRTRALIAIAIGAGVVLALSVGFLALQGPSWERDVRAAIDAEMQGMTATEQAQMCFAMSFLGIEDGSSLLDTVAALDATGELGLEDFPKDVDSQEVFDVAVDQINSYC